MKRLCIILFVLVLTGATCLAQPKSFGLRAGKGLEICYQHDSFPGFWEFDCGVLDFGLYPGMRMTAAYDLKIAKRQLLGGTLSAFVGPGVSAGIHNKSSFAFCVLAQAGLEYSFNRLPLEISADIRPELWLGENGFEYAEFPDIIMPMGSVRWKF